MTKPIEGYPLHWPIGWPRLESYKRQSSPYQVDFTKARDDLVRELTLAGARDVVLSSNVPLRRDGLPLSGMSEPKDPGVAVYFTDRKKRSRVIPNDHWRTVRENVRGLGYAVTALRMLERCGSGEVLDRAYAGFALLPETAGPGLGNVDAWQIFDLMPGSSPEVLKRRYRELAAANHPDRGGNKATFQAINDAYKRLSAEVGT